jgi:hypothetical protein
MKSKYDYIEHGAWTGALIFIFIPLVILICKWVENEKMEWYLDLLYAALTMGSFYLFGWILYRLKMFFKDI